MIICLGPVCVPISALIPGLLLLWNAFLKCFRVQGSRTGASEKLRREWVDDAERNLLSGQATEIKGPEQWEEIQKTDIICVLMFTAKWCAPCKTAYPTFAELSGRHKGEALFLLVDADRNEGLALSFGVKVYPTFIVVQGSADQKRCVLGTLRGLRGGLPGLENFVGHSISHNRSMLKNSKK